MSIRFRLPTELADRVAARAARDGLAASSVTTALRIIDAHVDDDLGGRPAPRRTLTPHPEQRAPGGRHEPRTRVQ